MADYNGGNAFNIGQGETYGGGDATTEYTSTAMDGGYASLNDADITPSTILMRRDKEANWKAENPTLAEGEIGVVTDKRYFKIGDGDNAWNSLKTYDVGVNIEQELGDSETSVMSQNAVTTVFVELMEGINTMLNNLRNSIEKEFTTKINEETTKRSTADTAIKNTMVKSCVSTDEAFNDVVKELYFDRWVDITKISTIELKRNGISQGNIVWEMYIIDTNGKSSWASFGKKAENYDVNVSTLGTQAGHFLSGKGVTVYAVIDWNKVHNNNGVGEVSDHFSVNGKMLSTINNAKYFPKISECLVNHKYTHSPVANSVIKELYFENLTKNGTPVSVYEFERYFSLQRIDRYKLSDDNSGKRVWSLVFYINNTDVDTTISGVKADNHFFEQITVSPEKDVVLKMPMSTTLRYPDDEGVLTDYKFSATVYAVIDWTKLKNGEYTTIIAPLLSGCIDVRNSPIIYNYIEINKLREELNLRPINNEE